MLRLKLNHVCKRNPWWIINRSLWNTTTHLIRYDYIFIWCRGIYTMVLPVWNNMATLKKTKTVRLSTPFGVISLRHNTLLSHIYKTLSCAKKCCIKDVIKYVDLKHVLKGRSRGYTKCITLWIINWDQVNTASVNWANADIKAYRNRNKIMIRIKIISSGKRMFANSTMIRNVIQSIEKMLTAK